MKQFADVYRGKRVLVTGHTGFKGSWLVLWLQELGAHVTGVSLSTANHPNHWDLLMLQTDDRRFDIRDAAALQRLLNDTQPDIVFHLAAQPLVRRSYRDPLETWSVNIMGTANVLEACRHQPSVRAIVVITTDKCYENREWPWAYRENDRLGGHDPYSASKASVELVAASYRHSFFKEKSSPLLATARAGNVIGGGDWAEDRLIPDLIRAHQNDESLFIRSPQATRPWQHVLDPLSGYLLLGQTLLDDNNKFASAWNFGPESSHNQTVLNVLEKLSKLWPNLRWQVTAESQPYEATLLNIDSSKACRELHWKPVWNVDSALEKTAEWYRVWLSSGHAISRQQLHEYITAAVSANIQWAQP